MNVTQHKTAREFLERAGEWLHCRKPCPIVRSLAPWPRAYCVAYSARCAHSLEPDKIEWEETLGRIS
jgi:hypothetical protein